MASHRVANTGFSDSGPSNHHLPYTILHGINSASSSFMYGNQEGSTFDFGELEEAIVLQGIRNDESKAPLLTSTRPAATLEMFPSWPIRFQQTPRPSSKSGGESTDSGSAANTLSSKADQATRLEPESPMSKKASSSDHYQAFDQKHLQLQTQQQQQLEMAGDISRSGPSHQQNQSPAKPSQEKRKGAAASERQLDAKTLRRLAQNREAARKSRLRKKVQLHSQKQYNTCIPTWAAIFDMEYARWLEEDHRYMSELRTAMQAHLSDGDLRLMVDGYISHYDEIFQLKMVAAKSDIFHLITGMWTTPAERCFLWMGGFRPSDLIKMLISQLDPLTEQQVVGIYSLQHSSQQAEEALSQGLEQLQQSMIETIAAGPVVDGMQQMALALGKLANLEGFVRQADNLRQQTLHQLRRILTVKQAARCFLVIGEYYGRLRTLSSLWTSRPRESMMSDDNSCQTTTDLQMVRPSQNHFPSF
ncbi:transcription factor TGA2-like isoform X2 [Tripterygium wilfordii]|uniref:Transcription factor TGA2-like isoform X2 n=1 Tax=Tripterygium wilfordii TaxID=458696 RepID=A0A7J7DF19_TRIWF|nr:transcription factor TGA2-like isoform X2 [Tripterygium wilfordii]KAF5744868.1 transcription factor TGA2-like isoform X2 [Tripterygium wilfordii]